MVSCVRSALTPQLRAGTSRVRVKSTGQKAGLAACKDTSKQAGALANARHGCIGATQAYRPIRPRRSRLPALASPCSAAFCRELATRAPAAGVPQQLSRESPRRGARAGLPAPVKARRKQTTHHTKQGLPAPARKHTRRYGLGRGNPRRRAQGRIGVRETLPSSTKKTRGRVRKTI